MAASDDTPLFRQATRTAPGRLRRAWEDDKLAVSAEQDALLVPPPARPPAAEPTKLAAEAPAPAGDGDDDDDGRRHA